MAVPRPLMVVWVLVWFVGGTISVPWVLVQLSAGLTGEDPPPTVFGLSVASTSIGLLWGLMTVYFLGVMRSEARSTAAQLVDALRGKSVELKSSGDATRALVAGSLERVSDELANPSVLQNPWPLLVVAGALLVASAPLSTVVSSLALEVAADPLAAVEELSLIMALGTVGLVIALLHVVLLLYALHSLNGLLGVLDRSVSFSFESVSRLVPVSDSVKRRRIGERSTLLYALLTLITLGVFQLYWVWALNEDLSECERRAGELLRLLSRV
ncbi:MAG: DUF4234 domain-containing protein [Nitrososphaeria archaeon]|nr:DUF4234 domain-containing protein [Nitrososphaeria archaeon]